MPLALDATYSFGAEISGVGVYCRELLSALADAHPDERFWFCYRPHRYLRSWRETLPSNTRRFLLHDKWRVPSSAELFHGLNQRLPDRRLRRTVTTFHDLFVLTGDYSTPEFRRKFAMLARHAAEMSDLIIAVSQFTADQVQSLLHVETSRIRVVHHGVRPLPARLRTRSPIILHVGAIQQRKNIVRLVKAFESVGTEWRLVLAGSEGFGAQEATAAIEASPARSRIEVTGYVSLETLADLYSGSSIFAFPSLDEGFGMPVLEAMATGLPVLASNRSALPEVCGDAALLVDPEDTSSIAESLVKLTTDVSLREELARRGTARAQTYTWKKAAERTFGVYRELL